MIPVPDDALPKALESLARLRYEQPELVAWIEEGAPRLSAEAHRRRFGEDYRPSTTRKRRG